MDLDEVKSIAENIKNATLDMYKKHKTDMEYDIVPIIGMFTNKGEYDLIEPRKYTEDLAGFIAHIRGETAPDKTLHDVELIFLTNAGWLKDETNTVRLGEAVIINIETRGGLCGQVFYDLSREGGVNTLTLRTENYDNIPKDRSEFGRMQDFFNLSKKHTRN